MPLNSEILSRFVVEEESMNYMMEIKIRGPCPDARRYLMHQLSFDVERGYEFYGTPILENGTTTQRIVVIKLPSQDQDMEDDQSG